MASHKWTRRDECFAEAIRQTALRCQVSEERVEHIVLRYLYRIKILIMQGFKVQLPGIIRICSHHSQIKQNRKGMVYKQLKSRYGDKGYFKEHVIKVK